MHEGRVRRLRQPSDIVQAGEDDLEAPLGGLHEVLHPTQIRVVWVLAS